MTTVTVERLPHAADLPLPSYETEGAAGMDLRAALAAPITLAPFARALVPTGLRIALPPGFEAQVRPRSGLALRHGLTVLNAPGTVDADYRGEVQVLLVNLGGEPVEIAHGMRIAQMVVVPVTRVTPQEGRLDATPRGGRRIRLDGHVTEPEARKNIIATSTGAITMSNTKSKHPETPSEHPKSEPTSNAQKDPDNWTTGDETMTGAQASYLKTLSEEAGEEFDPKLSKAEASKRIDALQGKTGRGQ